MVDDDMAYFEHDMDVAVELYLKGKQAKEKGLPPPSFDEVERQVDVRRKEDRRLESEWQQPRRTTNN